MFYVPLEVLRNHFIDFSVYTLAELGASVFWETFTGEIIVS